MIEPADRQMRLVAAAVGVGENSTCLLCSRWSMLSSCEISVDCFCLTCLLQRSDYKTRCLAAVVDVVVEDS